MPPGKREAILDTFEQSRMSAQLRSASENSPFLSVEQNWLKTVNWKSDTSVQPSRDRLLDSGENTRVNPETLWVIVSGMNANCDWNAARPDIHLVYH